MTIGWADLALAARGPGEARTRVRAAMSERVPSQGGFLVPEELRADMVLASLEAAIIRPLATVIPVSTLRTGLPVVDDTTHASSVFGGMAWSWTEEGQAITASSAAYARGVLEAKKLAAYLGGVPDELLADAPAFEAFMRAVVPMGLAWSEDQAFIAGTGTAGQPQGVLNAPCAIPVTRTTSLQADVANMVTRMLPQSFQHCIWLCSPDKTGALLQIFLNFGSATTGVTAPSGWLQANPTDGWTLLGRPIKFTEHVPASGTKGDLILVDPRFYVIADRKQMEISASAKGAKFPLDETEFRIVSRLDGRIWLQSPVTPQNSSQTVSPVVILT
jgi:HK97 family phage major capsid protein